MMAIDEAEKSGARLCACCQLVELGVRTIQRWRACEGGEDMRMGPKTEPKNKLSTRCRAWVLSVMNQPEFRNLPPSQIVPLLADSGKYVASESTMYRVLREEGQNTNRGRKRTPRKVSKPAEQIAAAPREVFSWDITYLRSPIRGEHYYLYMMLDVWSRKIVGHVVHEAENSELAAEFVEEVYRREGEPPTLVLHQDNGSPMKGSTLVAKLDALCIQKSYSRPRVSNDNPYSESAFGTMKTRPDYPSRPFPSLDAASAWVDAFVAWYNDCHRHSSIGFVTPSQRHDGKSAQILRARRKLYESARRRRPERWSGKIRAWTEPSYVFLNPDTKEVLQK